MALSDIAAEMTAVRKAPWRTCLTCDALANLNDQDAAQLRDLLANPMVRYTVLEDKLANDPDAPTIPWESLSRHARGKCDAKEKLR